MWRIQQTQAILNAPGLTASVDLRRPDDGITNVRHGEMPASGARLLQIRPRRGAHRAALLDAYVRGPDLVASYRPASSESLAIQVYWRFIAFRDLDAVGLELIVSVQTDLLDDDPCSTVGSELPCGELRQAIRSDPVGFASVDLPAELETSTRRQMGIGLFLYRPDATRTAPPSENLSEANLPAGAHPTHTNSRRASALEMVHPADFAAGEFMRRGGSGLVQSQFALFEERLEKGVIRRARMAAVLLACDARDDEPVADQCYRRWLTTETPLSV